MKAEAAEKARQAKEQADAIIEARRARLPTTITKPVRNNTVALLPMADGRPWYGCMKGLMQIMPQISGIIDQSFSSLIQLSRNKLINGFLRTPCEWAFMIDCDIEFTARDFNLLIENAVALAALAPYARKDNSEKLIERGLGFALVHRSVIQMICSEIAVPFVWEGIEMRDCFITGATSTGGFLGEDAGFWWMCSQVGVMPHIERRTQLVHWGPHPFKTPDVVLSMES